MDYKLLTEEGLEYYKKIAEKQMKCLKAHIKKLDEEIERRKK